MEEKEAIKNLKEIIQLSKEEIENNDQNTTAILDITDLKSLAIILNMLEHTQTKKSLKGIINKQNKEIQELKADRVEKDKIIGLMAEYMEEEFAEYQLDNIYAELYNCNGMERNWTRGKEKEIEDIIKYFQKKASEENDI